MCLPDARQVSRHLPLKVQNSAEKSDPCPKAWQEGFSKGRQTQLWLIYAVGLTLFFQFQIRKLLVNGH